MLAPSLFNDNFGLFDHFYQDPWFGFGDREFKNLEKELYGQRTNNIMSTDIKETDTEYEMAIDLPGFKKEDINVALENGYLTISATRDFEKNEADSEEAKAEGKYIRRERYSGSCKRSFYVGKDLKVENVKANFQHGILNLIIPKKDKEEIEASKYVAIEGGDE